MSQRTVDMQKEWRKREERGKKEEKAEDRKGGRKMVEQEYIGRLVNEIESNVQNVAN